MKVHLKQIPAIGIHLEGEEDHDILELDDDQVHPIGTVDYSLDIGVSRSSLFATGEIGADFELVRTVLNPPAPRPHERPRRRELVDTAVALIRHEEVAGGSVDRAAD